MKNIKSLGYLAAIFSGLSFGTIPILAAILRNNNASSLEQSVVRFFFGAAVGFVIFLFFLIVNKHKFLASLRLSSQKTYILQGLLLSFMIVLYLSSISLGTPAGEAAFLIQIHPILTLIVGRLLLDEKITKTKLISIFVALAGIILLTEPWKWESFLQNVIGDVLMILLGILYAGYLLINRWGTKYTKEISPSISIGWVLIWAAITGIPMLFLLSLLPLPTQIISFSFEQLLLPKIIGYGFLLALFGSLVSYGLIMFASKYVESSKISILVLSEPIGAMILGVIVLQEQITTPYIFGGIFILIAGIVIFLTSFKKENKEKESIEII